MNDETNTALRCGSDGAKVETATVTGGETIHVRCPACGQEDTLKEAMAEVARDHILKAVGKKPNSRWTLKEA